MTATGMRPAGLLLLAGILQGCATLPDPPPAAPRGTSPDVRIALLGEIESGMVAIPEGSFQMGSTSGLGEDEHPVHRVTLRAFHLSRYEATRAQYLVFLRTMGRPAENVAAGADQPAVNISWDDAQDFIAWLNEAGGEKYRLPTEAEWEYAARAGSVTEYPWGSRFERDFVNGAGVGGRDEWLGTAPVGRFAANAFGLHDMLGNVWEWTADCYYPDYESAPVDGSARTGEEACGRVLRGGSWSDIPAWLRTATRNWFDRGDRFDYVGFRLARD